MDCDGFFEGVSQLIEHYGINTKNKQIYCEQCNKGHIQKKVLQDLHQELRVSQCLCVYLSGGKFV